MTAFFPFQVLTLAGICSSPVGGFAFGFAAGSKAGGLNWYDANCSNPSFRYPLSTCGVAALLAVAAAGFGADEGFSAHTANGTARLATAKVHRDRSAGFIRPRLYCRTLRRQKQ